MPIPNLFKKALDKTLDPVLNRCSSWACPPSPNLFAFHDADYLPLWPDSLLVDF
jgi:hypothetical protein